MTTSIRNLMVAVGTIALAAISRPAMADIIAQDNFSIPGYSTGTLAGQAVGGTGFTGNWVQDPTLMQDLSIVSGGAVGRPTVTAGNGGNDARFATPITFGSGQLFISYTIDNLLGSKLNSTRLDLNDGASPIPGDLVMLGGLGADSDFNFSAVSGLGTTNAQTSISTTGIHHLVGVLDMTNDRIAIFVDPTSASFYNADGTNDANAVAAWTPTGTLNFGSYTLIENLSDQVNFDNVIFATDAASVGLSVPEPASVALLGVGLFGMGLTRRRRRL